MRASRLLWAFAAIVVMGAVASSAEASDRRRGGRRGAPSAAPKGPARSDEAIQAVLQGTPAGGIALLPAGIFRTAIVIDRPLTLMGSPAGTVLDATGLSRPVIEVRAGVVGVTIESLRLQGAGVDGLLADGGNDRLGLRQLTIAGSAGVGARIGESGGVVLDRCTFEGNGGGGLDASGPGLRASRLSFRGNGGAAADLRGKDARLSDSTFEGGATGIVFEGVGQSSSRDSFRSVALPVRFASTSDTCAFERSDVRDAATGVVADLGSIYASITANRFDRTAGDVVRLAGSWHAVRGNAITGAGGAAVTADGSSFQVEDNTIGRTGGAGIVVSGPGNMVDGNVLSDTRGGAVDVQGDGNVVAVNASTASGADGIVIVGAMNRVVGNRVLRAKGDALVVTGDANTLQDNVCQGALGDGIRVVSGNANLLQTNTILLCGLAGLFDGGAGTVLAQNKID